MMNFGGGQYNSNFGVSSVLLLLPARIAVIEYPHSNQTSYVGKSKWIRES